MVQSVITVPCVCRLSPQTKDTFTQYPEHNMYFRTLTDVKNKNNSSEVFPDSIHCALENAFVPPELVADLLPIAQYVGFNFKELLIFQQGHV